MFDSLLILVSRFSAAAAPPATGAPCKEGGSFLGFPTWYHYLPADPQSVAGKCTPMIDLTNHPGQISLIVLALIEILLRVAGVVAVGFVIYGGYQFILSQGEPDRATSARNTIINAVIGLVISISATVIVSFVATNLIK